LLEDQGVNEFQCIDGWKARQLSPVAISGKDARHNSLIRIKFRRAGAAQMSVIGWAVRSLPEWQSDTGNDRISPGVSERNRFRPKSLTK
jgi:hypothetical protein